MECVTRITSNYGGKDVKQLGFNPPSFPGGKKTVTKEERETRGEGDKKGERETRGEGDKKGERETRGEGDKKGERETRGEGDKKG